MRFRLVQELAVDGVPVAVACRELGVSPSGYYEWRGRAPSARAVVDAALSTQIVEIHTMSRGSYGVPRMHLELRLGRGVRCGRKRIARLMRAAHVQGIYRSASVTVRCRRCTTTWCVVASWPMHRTGSGSQTSPSTYAPSS